MIQKTVISIISILLISLKANVMFGQQIPCDIAYDGIDLSSKLYRTEVAPSFVFNHTPPEVKNDLQTTNLINCRGQLVQIENKLSLQLNIQVNSLMAQKAYGSIDKGSLLKVTLVDGKEVELKCYASSKGTPTEDEKAYTYPVAYELTGRMPKQLVKKEIDKIGVQWSSGYEEYVIYEVDFLMNQLSCLKQAREQKPN